jgi:hypothetical protein
MRTANHFSELGEATFSALSFLIHFRESLLRGALPKGALD